MPHVILDHSANLLGTEALEALLAQIHQTLVASGGCRPEDIKSRIQARALFRVGDGAPRNAYAHLEVGLLEGREPEALDRLGRACLAVLEQGFALALEQQHCDLTVELRPMRRDSYFKRSSHPASR